MRKDEGTHLKKHSPQDKYGTGRREEVVDDVEKTEQYWTGLWLFGAICIAAFGQSTDDKST